MGAHTYEEDPVTTPLGSVEPGLPPLGTIEEAKEGSTADESEGENSVETLQAETREAGISTEQKTVCVGEEEKGGDEEEAGEDHCEDEKEDEKDEDEEPDIENLLLDGFEDHPDVDGGWAWVILFAMFGVFIITSGLLQTTGIYYVQMLAEYGHSRSYTAWMGSLINAFFMLGGPVSAVIICTWGCRLSLIIGSLLMAGGYLASAFTTSLEALFFTYGVVVACGMNLTYSGQIAALNQNFHKRHSIATSIAMLGIGLGMFFLSKLTEYNIDHYGWRGSLVWNAGVSLQIVVFGFLVFPLRPIPESSRAPAGQQPEKVLPEPSHPLKPIQPSKSRILLGKPLNHRSFSSLRLSAEASYLGHSQLSLMDSQPHLNNLMRSNQHSFCSKGSHLVIGSIRSNGHSFCRDSHTDDLHSNQFMLHHKDSFAEFGLHSNAHSFCSRRDSQSFIHPHHHHHHYLMPEGEGDSLKGSCGGGRARFLLREGECDQACCVLEEEEDACPSEYSTQEHQSLCLVMARKVKHKIQNAIKGVTRKSEDSLCANACFWLLDLAFFFAMLGTMCLFVIYNDFAVSKTLGEHYTTALSVIGMGDLVGRLSVGFMLSCEFFNPLLMYSLLMLFCGVAVLCHSLIASSTHFLVLASLFGFFYGTQNVLIAVTPSKVFGREKLSTVFGYILFLGGIGALIGAPIAGFIVDSTDSFDGVLLFSSLSLVAGAAFLLVCFMVHRSSTRPRPPQIHV